MSVGHFLQCPSGRQSDTRYFVKKRVKLVKKKNPTKGTLVGISIAKMVGKHRIHPESDTQFLRNSYMTAFFLSVENI